jgi:hypothetical protein
MDQTCVNKNVELCWCHCSYLAGSGDIKVVRVVLSLDFCWISPQPNLRLEPPLTSFNDNTQDSITTIFDKRSIEIMTKEESNAQQSTQEDDDEPDEW